VQPFYRRSGGGGGAGRDAMEEGATGTRSRQGRGVADASRLSRRESTSAWRARASRGRIWGGANRWQEARSTAGRGPLGVSPWHGLPGRESLARWPTAAAPRRDRTGKGREEG
jgi:hypothetical protein